MEILPPKFPRARASSPCILISPFPSALLIPLPPTEILFGGQLDKGSCVSGLLRFFITDFGSTAKQIRDFN